MGKPFRVANEVVRTDAGRFAQRYRQPSPPEIIRKSTEGAGTEVLTLLSEEKNQAPDHDPIKTWGPASNPRPPMRLNK